MSIPSQICGVRAVIFCVRVNILVLEYLVFDKIL